MGKKDHANSFVLLFWTFQFESLNHFVDCFSIDMFCFWQDEILIQNRDTYRLEQVFSDNLSHFVYLFFIFCFSLVLLFLFLMFVHPTTLD